VVFFDSQNLCGSRIRVNELCILDLARDCAPLHLGYSFLCRQKSLDSLLLRHPSIADPASGAFLTSGSGIGVFWFPDLVFRIPNPYFWERSENFLSKKYSNCSSVGSNFFLHLFKIKVIFNLWNIWLKKKLKQEIYFFPSSSVVGSRMDKNRNPG
jgi:hypothetical protein